MKTETLSDTQDHITQHAVDEGAAELVPVGSLLIVVRGMILAHTFTVTKLLVPMAINQDLKALTSRGALGVEFLSWLLRGSSRETLDRVDEAGHGTKVLRIEAWTSLPLPVPVESEQALIVRFLEQETAKIDALVDEQRRLIALLKEKRQAVISHAVTRGLSPDAPMKPSGVDWLGDVPAHWGVTPLKYEISLRSGGTPSKANLAYWDGELPWASSKDLKSETLIDTQDHITERAIDDGAAELVPTGSILIVVRGMILAHTFPVTKALAPMAINQDLKALTPRRSLEIDFLAWLLRAASSETLGRIDEAGHGTKALRLEAWTSMAVPVPPSIEQRIIAAFLDTETAKLDTLTAEAERAIALLQERRTALISAAVTGQIDVRGAIT